MSDIRYIRRQDLPDLKNVVNSTGLFPAELLDGMTESYFQNPDGDEIWLTKEVNGVPVSVAYCAEEKLTQGTFNLYLISVHTKQQGRGLGTELLQFIELLLIVRSKRLLIVETSSLPEFERTRTFYDQSGFTRAAMIPDFYKEGEGKVIFYKKLSNS